VTDAEIQINTFEKLITYTLFIPIKKCPAGGDQQGSFLISSPI
jgi:hypothetical protein